MKKIRYRIQKVIAIIPQTSWQFAFDNNYKQANKQMLKKQIRIEAGSKAMKFEEGARKGKSNTVLAGCWRKV